MSVFEEEANSQWEERMTCVAAAGGEREYLEALKRQKKHDATRNTNRYPASKSMPDSMPPRDDMSTLAAALGGMGALQLATRDARDFETREFRRKTQIPGLEPRQTGETVHQYKQRVRRNLKRKRDDFMR